MTFRVLLVASITVFFTHGEIQGQAPLIDESFGVQRVATGCIFTEGPVVDEQGVLFFSDGPNDRVMKLTPDGELSVWLKPCGAANGLLFDLNGRLLMCQSARPGGARALAVVKTDGGVPKVDTLTEKYEGQKYIAPNDLCIAANGSIFFTDPYYDGDKSQPKSGVYRRDPDGAVSLLLDDLQKPNGIVITSDDQWIYVSDRGTQKLHRYRVNSAQQLIDDEVIYDFSPDRGIDGMWLDEYGNIYGAAGEGETTGLFVISPKGKLLLHKPLPEFATNVTFGGDDMRDVYVTATTSVYKLRSRNPGLRHRYARSTANEIKRIIAEQSKAWNAGDIAKFMTYYWKSEHLTFSSGGTTRRGWDATLERYRTRYPTREIMGSVRFTELEVSELGDDVALVLGRWRLDREVGDDIGGNFSLVFRRINGRWLIIHDHTSQLASE
jgi:gluconolactonase